MLLTRLGRDYITALIHAPGSDQLYARTGRGVPRRGFASYTHLRLVYATTPELTVVPQLRCRMRRHDAMAANWCTGKALNDKPEKFRLCFDRLCRPGRLIPITFIRQGNPNTDVPDNGLDSLKNCCAASGNERNQRFAPNGSRGTAAVRCSSLCMKRG